MIDFEKLDRLFEVTYDENKACMFAYVWAKKKESVELDSKKHIKLSDAFNKVKDHKWHFYPGDENNLTTYLVTGLLNKELGAFETDDITLFLDIFLLFFVDLLCFLLLFIYPTALLL